MPSLDDTDVRILEILAENGRASWKAVAEDVGLSAPSVLERVRKLERGGFVRGYTVLLDPVAVGLELLAFVSVVGGGPKFHANLQAQLVEFPEILECHVTDGAYDYLLKLRCRSSGHLMDALQRLRSISGVESTHTTVTLATLKETSTLSLRPGRG